MPTGSDKDIERLRELSREIDELFVAGKDAQGAELLERTLKEAETLDDAYALFFQGERCGYIDKDFETQEPLFRRALELRPDDFFLLRNMGICLSNLSRFDEALVMYDKALEIKPEDYDSWRNKGVSLSELGRNDEALVMFDKALDIKPVDYGSWRQKAVTLYKLGRVDEALVLFDKALELNPEDYRSWFNKGVLLSNFGHDDAALVVFDKALALNPKNHNTLRQKGVSLSELDRVDEALDLFEQALALNPKDHNALREKGVSFSKLGLDEDALDLFEQALALCPNDHDALRQKGVSLSKLGRSEEALKFFDQILSVTSKNKDALAAKSYALFMSGRSREALELIREVAREYPKFEYAQKMLRYLSKFEAMEEQASGDATPQSGTLSEGSSRKPEDLAADSPEMKAVVAHVRKVMGGEIARFKESMAQTRERLDSFLLPESRLDPARTLFFVLRKWNSYTPSIPRNTEDRGVGGGYFIWNKGQGTVIDPGYNFIENFEAAGFRIADIHNIILTHAHNDHTIDFESILTLIYKYNDKKNLAKTGATKKAVKVFLNAGSQKKFSGMLDLRGADYLDFAYTLMPGHSYDFGNGMTLRALPAYHDEVIGMKYSVGLRFSFDIGAGPAKIIVMTSDTGLYPQVKDNDGSVVADYAGEEIWKRYDLKGSGADSPDGQKIDLLVPHLGSVRAKEFETDFDSKQSEVYYPNHLGVIGTVRVISALRPKLAVVSEFGEELRDVQEDLIKMLEKMVEGLCDDGSERPKILPGDLSFVYDVMTEKIYCPISETFYEANKVSWSYPNKKDFSFYYKCGSEEDASKLESASKEFLERRRAGDALYFKK